jgi:tetratricopeptide (TPR) repeat protein
MLNGEAPIRPDESPATDPSRLVLPPVPSSLSATDVAAWVEPMMIDTYLPEAPDTFPAFLDNRVYQGSSGRVYPLPFHERIAQEKAPYRWQAIHLENRWVRLVILPELGGRIHVALDKTTGYDFFYRNNVIKPALVGLAGPWISGGVEFNWPQHHRPGTFLPTDYTIEREVDGAVTVWCSDHDPFTRMKGMHGIRVRPNSSVIEARVRLFNRTEETQTFLWWANVAAPVNDDYQSFFPTDVHHVADHAKRAVATFPRVEGRYYGVDYPSQKTSSTPDADRLDWYRNIPVPTSYMVVSTDDDFFGGYDHGENSGFIYVADRHVAPGKKQWTWGNAAFGHSWEANLTDTDGPYVELMAGAFTDNQPDFAYLSPGETKTFSQFWYPFHGTGPVHQATTRAAVRLDLTTAGNHTRAVIGVNATEVFADARVTLADETGIILFATSTTLAPSVPFIVECTIDGAHDPASLTVSVLAGSELLVEWRPRATSASDMDVPNAAVEPAAPSEIESMEELFLVGQYLAQYRHATRRPEPYWEEALRRDPGDVRCNTALSERLHWAGDFVGAERLLRTALARLTAQVSTPATGATHYRLGIELAHQRRDVEAEGYLAKAAWDSAWRVPARVALGRIFLRAGRLAEAEEVLKSVLALDSDHLQAANLLSLALRCLNRPDEAASRVKGTLTIDPLDQWARHLAGRTITDDAPTLVDVALEYSAAGQFDHALKVLDLAAVACVSTALGQVQVGPLVHYHRAALLDQIGRSAEAESARAVATSTDSTYCLASRLEDIAALQAALTAEPTDGLAALLLGNWYYDRRRFDDAIHYWTLSGAVIAERNLGIAAFNVLRDPAAARAHFQSALALAPRNAKLLFEADQLAARLGDSDTDRRAHLERNADLVSSRDDLTVELAGLLTTTGSPDVALHLLESRHFQPWEGGEGQVIAAWENAHLALAQRALEDGDADAAVLHIQSGINTPLSLGEARHPLVNSSRLYLALGDALSSADRHSEARTAWTTATLFDGDFLNMSTQAFGDQTWFTILAFQRLGQRETAAALAAQLEQFVDELATTPAVIDFFATSLPSMLLFTDDPSLARDKQVHTIRTQLAQLSIPTGS